MTHKIPLQHHTITWTIDEDLGVQYRINCHAPEGASCRLRCVERCGDETYPCRTVNEDGSERWHQLEDAGYCNPTIWINEVGTNDLPLYVGEKAPLRNGPIKVYWDGYSWVWSYPEEAPRNDAGDLSAEIAALEQEVKRIRIAYRNAAKRAMARRRLLAYWQKDWKKKYEELKRLRTKLFAVREVYELALENAPKGQWYEHGFGVIADRLGQILGIRNVNPDMERGEECPAPSSAKDAGES